MVQHCSCCFGASGKPMWYCVLGACDPCAGGEPPTYLVQDVARVVLVELAVDDNGTCCNMRSISVKS